MTPDPTSPKTFDPVEFLAFVKGKPGDERYDGNNQNLCALAQFGFPGLGIANIADFGVPSTVYRLAAYHGDSTWSALASRLESLLAEQGEG